MCGEIRDFLKRERDICVRPIIPTEPKYGLRVESLLKTWSRTSMANAKQSGLALAYIHKPTVLKRWDTSGHRQIALAFSKEQTTGQKLLLSNSQGSSLLLLIMKVSDFLGQQV